MTTKTTKNSNTSKCVEYETDNCPEWLKKGVKKWNAENPRTRKPLKTVVLELKQKHANATVNSSSVVKGKGKTKAKAKVDAKASPDKSNSDNDGSDDDGNKSDSATDGSVYSDGEDVDDINVDDAEGDSKDANADAIEDEEDEDDKDDEGEENASSASASSSAFSATDESALVPIPAWINPTIEKWIADALHNPQPWHLKMETDRPAKKQVLKEIRDLIHAAYQTIRPQKKIREGSIYGIVYKAILQYKLKRDQHYTNDKLKTSKSTLAAKVPMPKMQPTKIVTPVTSASQLLVRSPYLSAGSDGRLNILYDLPKSNSSSTTSRDSKKVSERESTAKNRQLVAAEKSTGSTKLVKLTETEKKIQEFERALQVQQKIVAELVSSVDKHSGAIKRIRDEIKFYQDHSYHQQTTARAASTTLAEKVESLTSNTSSAHSKRKRMEETIPISDDFDDDDELTIISAVVNKKARLQTSQALRVSQDEPLSPSLLSPSLLEPSTTQAKVCEENDDQLQGCEEADINEDEEDDALSVSSSLGSDLTPLFETNIIPPVEEKSEDAVDVDEDEDHPSSSSSSNTYKAEEPVETTEPIEPTESVQQLSQDANANGSDTEVGDGGFSSGSDEESDPSSDPSSNYSSPSNSPTVAMTPELVATTTACAPPTIDTAADPTTTVSSAVPTDTSSDASSDDDEEKIQEAWFEKLQLRKIQAAAKIQQDAPYFTRLFAEEAAQKRTQAASTKSTSSAKKQNKKSKSKSVDATDAGVDDSTKDKSTPPSTSKKEKVKSDRPKRETMKSLGDSITLVGRSGWAKKLARPEWIGYNGAFLTYKKNKLHCWNDCPGCKAASKFSVPEIVDFLPTKENSTQRCKFCFDFTTEDVDGGKVGSGKIVYGGNRMDL